MRKELQRLVDQQKKLFGHYFDYQLIVQVIFQAKIPNRMLYKLNYSSVNQENE